MATRSEGKQRQSRAAAAQSRREERANRILDAAAELVQRYGYRKTTLDDVARQAGVAKGTLYLHWNTREALFGALMRRERLALLRDFVAHIAAGPERASLRDMFRQAALSFRRRPLLTAAFTRDVEVIGKLVRGEHSGHPGRKELFEILLDFLGQQNLVRRDLSPHAQSLLVRAVFLGFFIMASWMPDQCALADEELADMVADTVVSALERGRAVPPDGAHAASQAILAYLGQMTDAEAESFRQELQ